jgi:hypothetical protein
MYVFEKQNVFSIIYHVLDYASGFIRELTTVYMRELYQFSTV